MQAGEKINFIRSLSEFTPESPEDQRQAILNLYLTLCNTLVIKYLQKVESYSLHSPLETENVLSCELALRIEASDSSYIHIVINWISDSIDNVNDTTLKLRIAEHDPEGLYLNGYVYDISDESLVRSDVPAVPGRELKRNFSRIVAHSELNELLELGQSEWSSDKALAKVHMDHIDAILEAKIMDREFGFNEMPINLDELEKIAALLDDAVPYDVYI